MIKIVKSDHGYKAVLDNNLIASSESLEELFLDLSRKSEDLEVEINM